LDSREPASAFERAHFLLVTSALVLLNTFASKYFGLGFANEVMYLGGVAVASAVSFVHFLRLCGFTVRGFALASLVFGACGAIAAHGAWFEQEWCGATDGLVSSIPLVFVGCLAAMIVMTALHLKTVDINNRFRKKKD
jgi:pheromone shutdown protein TraB